MALIVVALLATPHYASCRAFAHTPRDRRLPARDSARTLPLRFERNVGQTDERVRFLTRARGMDVFFLPGEAVVRLTSRNPAREPYDPRRSTRSARIPSADVRTAAVRLRLVGASPTQSVAGLDPSPATVSYVRGHDAGAGALRVPVFDEVVYENAYPGIDVVWYGNRGNPEFDFVVRPGADVGLVDIGVAGASSVSVSREGDLEIVTSAGAIKSPRPITYQIRDGARRAVAGRFVKRPDGTVGVSVADYDRDIALVVDPSLEYAKQFGGTDYDIALGATADAAGSILVCGLADSVDFPLVNPVQGTFGGGGEFEGDAFVTKLTPDGSRIEFSTYLGGRGDDDATSIAVDASGAIYVAGSTESTDFPVRDAFQPALAGNQFSDCYLAKLAPDGSSVVFSTYLGGSRDDTLFGPSVAVDAGGSAYVAGATVSTDFPTTTGAYQPSPQDRVSGTAFVTKFAPDGASLVYSTYFSGPDRTFTSGTAVAVDADGSAILAGSSAGIPLRHPTQATLGGLLDAFVAKFTPSGDDLLFSTYVGGRDADFASGVAVDPSGMLVVAGQTISPDFPTKNAIQTRFRGGAARRPTDGFVCRIDPSASRVIYSTYLGGSKNEDVKACAVDSTGCAYVFGYTVSPDFPVYKAIQPEFGGFSDIFVSKINPVGSALVYSTYLGGSSLEDSTSGAGFYVDGKGVAYFAGISFSDDFPVTPGPLHIPPGGEGDVVAGKITDFYDLRFEPPDASASDPHPPPRALVAIPERSTSKGAEAGDPSRAGDSVPSAAGSAVGSYKIYRSATPGVRPSDATFFSQLPPTQTSTGATALGGSFFVVTAVYVDGTESEPSNEASGGGGEATVSSVEISGTRLIVRGAEFTDQVQVFVDGIPFVAPARVKRQRTLVQQKGRLLTGQLPSEFVSGRIDVVVSIRNSNGGIAVYRLDDR